MKPSNEMLRRLGAHLRTLREDRALTQEEVASRAGFTAKYLSECERGLRDLPLTSLRAIVEDGLGAGLDEIVTAGATDPERPPPPAANHLPSSVLALCRAVVALPARERRVVLAILRGALALTRRAES